jgi:hypothetical protein
MRDNKRFYRRAGIAALPVACLFLLFMIVQLGCAQEEKDPAKRLLSRSVRALGGEKRARGWNTRVERGILESHWAGWGHLRANCSRYVKKPDKMKIDNDYSAYDHPFFYVFYYNQGESWYMVNLNVRQHPRIKQSMEEALERVDGAAFFLAECDTFFQVMDVPDDSLLAGSTVERVGCIHEGDTTLFDLSSRTHLPLRRIDNGGTRHILFEDYRKTSGLKVPFHVTTYQNGRITDEQTWEDVRFNVELADSIFEENRPPKESPSS